eukprot:TRINITY_DN1369_c0_g1_i1.p1 TRINITY_DN1369_c0_g1~~TRINITY_DN1369_c0_g1_i1.p1  ORF type:complete len:101 (-),score=32.60 TRINITY_DN1369_c0_g1_i1:49-351(-)
MCIRDRDESHERLVNVVLARDQVSNGVGSHCVWIDFDRVFLLVDGFKRVCERRHGACYSPVLCVDTCLLYTSDAADDLLCVDLGGRRIIKKKNNRRAGEW